MDKIPEESEPKTLKKRGIRMTKMRLFYSVALVFLASPAISRDIPPFVSTDWLEQNLSSPGLLIIDVRSAAEYRKSHIPGSFNSSANAWAVDKNGLLRELPADRELLDLLGSLGIGEDSKVVAVGRGATDFDRADAIRVAWTILISGVRNVSVLDGGFSKWLKDKKAATGDPSIPTPGGYKKKINDAAVVSKNFVQSKIGKSVILDARTPEIYFGIETESWAQKPGHIESAINLPFPWIFTKEGILRTQSELGSMASAVVGSGKSKEYIVYCGVGSYAAAWSYIMTELLGYTDVKVYDGSMQEWIIDPAGPVTLYGWR
jgi:thiosulfate/3-mercaptopyruvate sulfurtransferase